LNEKVGSIESADVEERSEEVGTRRDEDSETACEADLNEKTGNSSFKQ
jgi:hypothetical protein